MMRAVVAATVAAVAFPAVADAAELTGAKLRSLKRAASRGALDAETTVLR